MRRLWLIPLLILCFSCAPTGTATSPAARLIGFAQGAVDLLAGTGTATPPGLLRAISAADPTLLPPGQLPELLGKLEAANRLLASLSAVSTPQQTQTVLRQVEGYVNDALMVLAAVSVDVPALAQYQTLIDAVTIAAQIVEQYVNSQTAPTTRLVLTPPQIQALRFAARDRGMTEARAARVMGVK